MKITDKAYAMLLTGQTVGAELPTSAQTLRAWVSVYPYVKEMNRIGVEVEHRYRGVGTPILHVLRFDIDASVVESPSYDYDHHMSNVIRADVRGDDMDAAIGKLELLLRLWNIDPAVLGPLGDDYPVL